MILGIVLFRLRVINDNFNDVSSKLVFNITLPALLFINISKTPISAATNYSLVLYGIVATVVCYLFLEVISSYIVPKKKIAVFSFKALFVLTWVLLG
jgi:hypothetical protein